MVCYRQIGFYMGFLSTVLVCMCSVMPLYACELQQPTSANVNTFSRHLIGSCTIEERETLAIPTTVLLEALQNGQSLDLQGVLITGDLMFDQLTPQPLTETSLASEGVFQVVKELDIQDGRIIQGSISIRDSVIQGTWATNLRKEYLLILGEVDISKTKFQRSVDFSQTLFFEKVNLSHSSIGYEGFVIRSHFMKLAMFEQNVFGTHSRFHKTRFRENVSFEGSEFQGVTEFLEVIFEKNAQFQHTAFQMGTGFSGAEFLGSANFERALFTREAYFRFAEFQKEANFRGVKFLTVSDYSHAQFLGTPNFEQVDFESPPNFADSNFEDEWQKMNTSYTLSDKLAFGLASIGLLCFLILGVKKLTQLSR